jgi:hypothetical protein
LIAEVASSIHPGLNLKVAEFPGIHFNRGSMEYFRILSTSHAKAVAWFLIDHKQQFGVLTINGINAFANRHNHICMLFEIGEVYEDTLPVEQDEADDKYSDARRAGAAIARQMLPTDREAIRSYIAQCEREKAETEVRKKRVASQPLQSDQKRGKPDKEEDPPTSYTRRISMKRCKGRVQKS